MAISSSSYVVYRNYVAFWGSEFSNFHPCSFKLDGIVWKSSEQYFMAKKALHFKDNETYQKILKADTPKEAKALGRQVKMFDPDVWSAVCEEYMYRGVYAKFSQNEDLKKLLLSDYLRDKHFVEGSPVDNIWGCGIKYDDPRIDDKANWTGANLLGKTLDRVRTELLAESQRL